MFDLSDDDAMSTQLEGKKLKNRGAKFKHDGSMGSEELDITENTPQVGEDVDVEIEQEFIERGEHIETEEERDERLKKEMVAACQQQELQDKQKQQQQLKTQNPNLELNKIERGIVLSQNQGRPVVNENHFRANRNEIEVEQNGQPEKKDDDKSIAAKMLPDIRGKGTEIDR